jgi:SAM-dependent methyltransferase
MIPKDLNLILRCPVCFKPISYTDLHLSCGNFFEYTQHGKRLPVLIDFDNSILDRNSFLIRNGETPIVRRKYNFIKLLFHRKKKITKKNISFIQKYLKTKNINRILIIGGGEIGSGLSDFYNEYRSKIYSFDIYSSDNVDFIADAHNIPLENDTIDFVIIQAVLEHVLFPAKVVSEIYRVLKDGGLVYSEIPFMQQVHEGPFDFTRFTHSGHRFLFRKFICINSGYTSGVGTALLWSLSYFFKSLFRSKLSGRIARVVFFWLGYFDDLVPTTYNNDACSGTYFLGFKTQNQVNLDIVKFYKGAG